MKSYETILSASLVFCCAACGPIEVFNPADPFSEEFALTQSILCAGGNCPGASSPKFVRADAVKFAIVAQAMVYVGRSLTVTVEARKADDAVETNFSGPVTLIASGSAAGAGTAVLSEGTATMTITNQLEENFTLSLADSAGTGLDASATRNVFSNRLHLYFTAGTTDGNMGGPANADGFCMGDANYPGGGTFKAMLVDGSTRIATVTGNVGDGQTGWVFKPNVDYYRLNGDMHIFTTGANSLFFYGSMNVPFGPSATRIWTGTTGSWTTSASTCGGFMGTGGNGAVGDANALGDPAINFGVFTCANMYGLVCVEQ